MTLEQHSRTLGRLHVVFGGLQTLFMLLLVGVFMFIFAAGAGEAGPSDEVPLVFFGAVMLFVVLFQALMTVPSFVAGYAILKQRPWAKTAGIVASIIEAMSFPHGTALAAYSFWFLFGKYDELTAQRAGAGSSWRGSLYGAPPPPAADLFTKGAGREREHVYRPPSEPPDWR
jgi:hypothetical protein